MQEKKEKYIYEINGMNILTVFHIFHQIYRMLIYKSETVNFILSFYFCYTSSNRNLNYS